MKIKMVILKANKWKIPIRLDKKRAEVVSVSDRGNYRVRVVGNKSLLTIDPENDIYDEIEVTSKTGQAI